MNILAIGGVALVLAVGFQTWRVSELTGKLAVTEAQKQAAERSVDLERRARRNDAATALANYNALQDRCRGEAQLAADAGRTIGRITNAPPSADGRRSVGAGDLRIIAGQPNPGAAVPAQPDRRRRPHASDPR